MENFQIHSIPKNTQEQNDKIIETTNEMQVNLAIYMHSKNEDDTAMTEDEAMSIFVTSGEHLRFRKLINNYPKLIQDYKEKPEETLQIIEASIREKEYLH